MRIITERKLSNKMVIRDNDHHSPLIDHHSIRRATEFLSLTFVRTEFSNVRNCRRMRVKTTISTIKNIFCPHADAERKKSV